MTNGWSLEELLRGKGKVPSIPHFEIPKKEKHRQSTLDEFPSFQQLIKGAHITPFKWSWRKKNGNDTKATKADK